MPEPIQMRQASAATMDDDDEFDDISPDILAVGIDDKILLEAYPKEFYHLCQS